MNVLFGPSGFVIFLITGLDSHRKIYGLSAACYFWIPYAA